MRRFMLGFAVVALVAAACTDSSGTTATTTTGPGGTTGPDPGPTVVAARFDPGEVRFVAALEPFDRCEAFLDYIRAEALARVGPYGLEGQQGGGRFFAEEGAAFEDAAAPTVASATAPGLARPAAGVDFSGSNVQVLGVDEPDIVKTDGNRILAITDGRLHYVDVSGDEPRLRDTLRLGDGWDHRLFFEGDRALVFATSGGVLPEPFAAEVARTLPAFSGNPFVVISEIDLSDPDDLVLERTLRVQGSFLAARAVGETVRVVTSSYPAGLSFVYPSGPAAEEIALETNRRVIEESTLETWLPGYVLSAGEELLDQGIVAECERIHRPAEFAGFEMLSVLTLDLGGPLSPGAATTVTARGETVYASPESLYVATNVWVPADVFEQPGIREFAERYETALHKFDISGEAPAEYQASGSVTGHLLNQFSLNEYDGRLQVATTAGAPWDFQEDAESFVTVFNQDGDRLAQVGQVGDLGRGERIFSARFIDDVAYVVTFRQVDPLYVVDLSDPTAPRVEGELKIPGYSSYLHPIGDDRLLGVGQDADENGFTTGAKVSLFDVSDPTSPAELDTWTIGGGYSSAEWDHLAFLYWAPEQMAVLPMQAWEADFYGAVVLKTDDGLREFGRVSHDLDIASPTSDCRKLTAEDLGLDPADAAGGEFAQVCGPDDAGGAAGYYCEVFPEDQIAFIAEELEAESGVDLLAFIEPGERLEVCYPEFDPRFEPIQRSLVIGDELWTLTRTGLQSNWLADLELAHAIPLS